MWLDGFTKETIKMTFESLSHSRWQCKYHVVFVPKCRKKKLYGEIRKFLGPVFHELAQQRRSKILEGHMVQDHVHMLIQIPPKYAVSEVIGYIKGKSAIAVARQFGEGGEILMVKVSGQGVMRYQL
jgi:putative transposase